MSPVFRSFPSPTASGFTARRRARTSSAFLFPVSPERSPNQRTEELAPLSAPGSGVLDFSRSGFVATHPETRAADCPPLAPAGSGEICRDTPDFQKAAVDTPEAAPAPACDEQASAPLVGIARLASISPMAPTRRRSEERPEYFFLPVKSLLNRCDSNRVPFDWTINPYRGCEFACKYCYARYTHEFMDMDGAAFEKKIYVKKDAAVLLARDIASKYKFEVRRGGAPEHIGIGTATDPYQPAEREYGVTRACLEELARHEGLSVSITTKSNLITRDIDLLQKIAAQSRLFVDMTVTTLRPRLAHVLEPRAPRPDLRLAAIRKLREAGIKVGAMASPLLPGITDREGELEAVAEAAKEAGAQWFVSGVLFLMPSSAKMFLPFLREKFPRLVRQYEDWYVRNAYAPEAYRKKIAERVARIKTQLGMTARPWQEMTQPVTRQAQLTLSLSA
jgi:DNA repair photolyase